MPEKKVKLINQNSLCNIIPLFVYALPCSCLSLHDIALLTRLKKLYENCSVLFCINDLSKCPYAQSDEHSSTYSTSNLTATEVKQSPTCCKNPVPSTSNTFSYIPSVEKEVFAKNALDQAKIKALNALTSEHCDILIKTDHFNRIESISEFIKSDSQLRDCSFAPKSSKTPSKSCHSNIVQLKLALEQLDFEFIQLPRLSQVPLMEQNRQSIEVEHQAKSLIYRFDDNSRTIRVPIAFYLKKVLQLHITKAAKILNR